MKSSSFSPKLQYRKNFRFRLEQNPDFSDKILETESFKQRNRMKMVLGSSEILKFKNFQEFKIGGT